MNNKSPIPNPHPFMANSALISYQEMMKVAEVSDIEELFEQIPQDHRFVGKWKFEDQIASEASLHKHLTEILSKNKSGQDFTNYLGAGCWQHYVPAICDEMVQRTEFSTPVWGTPSSDHGRNQVWFEFCSQLGELVSMDFVGLPLYSYGAAAGHAIRMAARINGRKRVLIAGSVDPERLKVIKTYCGYSELDGYIEIEMVAIDEKTGGIDLADFRAKIKDDVTAFYCESPNYFGILESSAKSIAEITSGAGAEFIIGVDPITLGVVIAPGDFGADIVVGTTQSLGVHMNAGGGVGGFIATRDEERYAREYPTLQVSLTETIVPGEMAFGLTLFEQSSYGSREHGKDWTGNSVYLWTVANATYMSLLGPSGFKDIGEAILQRSHYAAKKIGEIPGVKVKWSGGFFKEFIVDFNATKKSVAQINKALLAKKIFGGKDLSEEFTQYGQSALYCVTEIHTQADIDALVEALKEVTR